MQVYDFDRNQLKELIEQYFSFDGIDNLCSSLSISPDNVRGNTKREKAWKLIEHCQNRSRLPDLLEELKKERPNVPWEQEVVVCFDSKQIAQNLNKLQLEKVCRKVNVLIENLSGEEIEEKVEALLERCKQSGQLRRLLTILEEEQPHVTWDTQLTKRVSPDGCSGQIGRLKWTIVLIGSFTILLLGLFYLSTPYASDKTAQETSVALAIQQTATSQAMVGMATISTPTLTLMAITLPTDTPTPTNTPTPTDTPTVTPTRRPIGCNHREIVPGIFPQLADTTTSSFFGASDNVAFECEGVFDFFREITPSVRLDYQAVADSYAFFSIGISAGLDVSSYDEICVWVYAEDVGQRFDLKLESPSGDFGVVTFTTETDEWEPHCQPLDTGYPGVDLRNVTGITLSFNDNFGSVAIWVDDFKLR